MYKSKNQNAPMKAQKNTKFRVIGAMSGTSLDGLDLAYCVFEKKGSKWIYSIVQTACIKYSSKFREKLANVENGTALDFVKMDAEFGIFTGKKIKAFVEKHKLVVDFIASHGHTIFHQPQHRFTSQIGNAALLAAESGISTVSDFRSLDVALGGQGAPLVPIGDQLLFSDYEYCLNLGGFANVSFQKKKKRIAFDICPLNIVINNLSGLRGLAMDKNGDLARRGKLNEKLLDELNDLKFYKKKFPKSLGKEWVLKEFFPILKKYEITLEEKLRTFYEHAAIQISKATQTNTFLKGKGLVLCTGGGTYNTFLMERISQHSNSRMLIPGKELIDFKEAMVFAFLGVLRMTEQVNCLQSVTGANADNTGGCVYLR